MKIEELQALRESITEAHAYRERLGGYSTDANTITNLYALLATVVAHLIEEKTAAKAAKKK